MRTITKQTQPQLLIGFRQSLGSTYSDLPADIKQQLRESLVKEQRGLCCYCMGRISSTNSKMNIEHWHSQAQYPDEQLSYNNMLASCKGNAGQPPNSQHCDCRKGKNEISRNPSNPNDRVEDIVQYNSNGTISSTDTQFNEDINNILNLNCFKLRAHRKAVLDGFIQTLHRQRKLRRPAIEQHLRNWLSEDSSGNLIPYCQVVVFWLRKRLAREL